MKACLGVLNLGGWDEDPAVEIGEHPFGPSLGTIDTDDTEVLRADQLDTGTDHATGLVDGLGSGRGAFLGLGSASHGKNLLERVWGEDQLPLRKSAWLLRVVIKIPNLPHFRGTRDGALSSPTGGDEVECPCDGGPGSRIGMTRGRPAA